MKWWLKTHWWGIRFSMNHELTAWIAAGSAGAAGALTTSGVASWVAVIAVGAGAALKAFDKGNGVRISITWALVSWIAPR